MDVSLRMSPNQSGTAPSDGTSTDGDPSVAVSSSPSTGGAALNNTRTTVLNAEEGGCRMHKGVGDDPMLTTDCPSYTEVMGKQVHGDTRPILKPPREDTEGQSDASTPSQKITIESIKGHNSEEEDDFEDDRSSVVSESSLSSGCTEAEGTFHEGLKRSADTLAVDAINCASDELQSSRNNVICVNSELRPPGMGSRASPGPAAANGKVNNGYVMSEVGKPSRSRDDKRKIGKELMVKEPGEIVPTSSSSVTTTSPTGQTTAIFNDSTDITVGNKTFITGSLTIKQYIKDGNTAQQRQPFWKSLSTRKKVGVIVGATAAVLALITLVVMLSIYSNDEDQTSQGSVLRIVSRGEWVAQPANDELANLKLPTKRVIIAHTATDKCLSQSECVFRVRYIQNFHIESQNFSDIGYNFMVGGDGAVYEGRGWDKQGAHTKGYNVGSICVAFIGTFTRLEPTPRQVNVAKLLLDEGVRLKKLDKDYNLFGHRQFYATESPGEQLFKIIQTWTHWRKDVD